VVVRTAVRCAHQSTPSRWRKNRRYTANRIQYLCLQHGLSSELTNIHSFHLSDLEGIDGDWAFWLYRDNFLLWHEVLGNSSNYRWRNQFPKFSHIPVESPSKKFKIPDKLLLDILGRLHFGTGGAIGPGPNWFKPTFQTSWGYPSMTWRSRIQLFRHR